MKIPRAEKLDRRGFHLTSISIHVIGTVLVYAILLRFVDHWPAFAGALTFGVHPLATAAVCPLAGRSSLLCGVLYLGALAAALCHAWLVVGILAIFAFMAKEEAIALPFALIGMLWIVRQWH